MNHVIASTVLSASLLIGGCRGSADRDHAKPGAASTSSGGPTGDIDVCGLMPAATIAQITGKAFTSADNKDKEPMKAFGDYSCDYTGPNQLTLSIVTHHGKLGYENMIHAIKAAGQNVVDVPGIGDAAFSSSIPPERLSVLYGDITIGISGWTELPIDQAKQIIGQLHDKLTIPK